MIHADSAIRADDVAEDRRVQIERRPVLRHDEPDRRNAHVPRENGLRQRSRCKRSGENGRARGGAMIGHLHVQLAGSFCHSAKIRAVRVVFVTLLLALSAFASERVPVVIILRDVPQAAATDLTGVDITARWRHIPAVAGEIDRADLARIAVNPAVLRVDVDSPGSGSLAESVPLIGADAVHLAGYTGKGITVAVLDTGITASHPDVAGAIVDEQCFCQNGDGTGCCPNGQRTQSGRGAAADDHGHGTNVTGIIASRGLVSSVGVAPGVSIVAVKVMDRNNRFTATSQVISGLDWIIDRHPEVRVINMSLGTSSLFSSYCDSTTAYAIAFADAIRTLRNRGTLVFVSTGNDASTTSMEAPACVQNATSVGAVYVATLGDFSFGSCSTSTATVDQVACFSNSNDTLDLLGPGARITSDGIGGGTSTFAGTSQASPHCAGSAAVLFAIKPSATPDEIESLLERTGKPVIDSRNGVTTSRVNLLGAASELLFVPSGQRHRAVGH